MMVPDGWRPGQGGYGDIPKQGSASRELRPWWAAGRM
jgi:hypothetical protein